MCHPAALEPKCGNFRNRNAIATMDKSAHVAKRRKSATAVRHLLPARPRGLNSALPRCNHAQLSETSFSPITPAKMRPMQTIRSGEVESPSMHPQNCGARRANTGPYRVAGPDRQGAKQSDRRKNRQPGGSRKQSRYQPRETCRPLHAERESDSRKPARLVKSMP